MISVSEIFLVELEGLFTK